MCPVVWTQCEILTSALLMSHFSRCGSLMSQFLVIHRDGARSVNRGNQLCNRPVGAGGSLPGTRRRHTIAIAPVNCRVPRSSEAWPGLSVRNDHLQAPVHERASLANRLHLRRTATAQIRISTGPLFSLSWRSRSTSLSPLRCFVIIFPAEALAHRLSETCRLLEGGEVVALLQVALT